MYYLSNSFPLGGLEIQSNAEMLSRQVVYDNKILFKYSGLLKLSFPFYKVRNKKQTANIISTGYLIWMGLILLLLIL